MIEDWSKVFTEVCETVTVEFEQFCQEVSETVDAMAEVVESAIATEVQDFWRDLFEPMLEVYIEFDSEWDDNETEFALTSKVEPTAQTHPACIGCRHYHGYVYSGNLLVCGMHPYGWDDENCPDWEAQEKKSAWFDEDSWF